MREKMNFRIVWILIVLIPVSLLGQEIRENKGVFIPSLELWQAGSHFLESEIPGIGIQLEWSPSFLNKYSFVTGGNYFSFSWQANSNSYLLERAGEYYLGVRKYFPLRFSQGKSTGIFLEVGGLQTYEYLFESFSPFPYSESKKAFIYATSGFQHRFLQRLYIGGQLGVGYNLSSSQSNLFSKLRLFPRVTIGLLINKP